MLRPRPVPLFAAGLIALSAPAAAQDRQGSRVETVQVRDQMERPSQGSAYLEPLAPPKASPPPKQIASEQVSEPDRSRETAQISTGDRSDPGMAQLSRAELEATLAQLSPAERRVLLEAIEGSDICDNPPDVPAIRTLCRNRIETRSSEFAETEEETISAEERLLRGGVDEGGTPNVERVIERLSRVSNAAPDDLDNQAIASIALAPPPSPPSTEDDGDALGNLPAGTEAVINAIINQLGGSGGGPR
jgi:hypothetical protein